MLSGAPGAAHPLAELCPLDGLFTCWMGIQGLMSIHKVLILLWILLFLYFVLFLNILILFLSGSYLLELKFSAGLGLPFSSNYSLAVLCNKVVSQISCQRHREVQMLGWIFLPCWQCFACRTRVCLQTVGG